MTASAHSALNKAYAIFDGKVREGLATLTFSPRTISARIKFIELPGFEDPIELIELTAEFPGATCLISFGESVVDTTLFFSEVEFHNAGKPTLFLRDYLANRKDPRIETLRFKTTDIALDQGISAICQMLMELFTHEFRPLLGGQLWLTAPFDWGDYK